MSRLKQSKIFQSKKFRLEKIKATKGTKPPLYINIAEGLMLGYKRTTRASKWYAKINGKLIDSDAPYVTSTLGQTDDYCNPDGVNFLSFTEAQEKLHGIKNSFNAGVKKDKPSILFSKLCDMYWDDYQFRTGERQCTTNKHYLDRIRLIEIPIRVRHKNPKPYSLKDVRIDHLTYEDLNSIKEGIANSPRKHRYTTVQVDKSEEIRKRKVTANKFTTVIKAVLNYGYLNKRTTNIKTNAEWLAFKKFQKVDKARQDWWDRDQCQRWLNYCNDEGLRNLFIGAISCGFRVGEQALLTVKDVILSDEGTSYVHLPALITKTKVSRKVIIATQFIDFYRSLIAGRNPEERLFLKTSGNTNMPHWGSNHHGCGYIKVTKAAGLQRMTWHSLRHTFASQLVEKGVKFKTIANQLGHSTTYYVEIWYGHLSDFDTLKEMDKMDTYHSLIKDKATIVKISTTGTTVRPVFRDGKQPYANRNFAIWSTPENADELLKFQNDPEYQELVRLRKTGGMSRGGGAAIKHNLRKADQK